MGRTGSNFRSPTGGSGDGYSGLDGRAGYSLVEIDEKDGKVDQVVIGEGSSTATFRSRTVSENDDTYAGESFVVEFNAEGVQVERVVFMFRFDWDNLVAFWSDLADSWRGWAGEKAWRSVEHDLAITATADALGHCVLTFTVRDGPMPTWTLTLTITMDGGEDMKSAADLFRAWTER